VRQLSKPKGLGFRAKGVFNSFMTDIVIYIGDTRSWEGIVTEEGVPVPLGIGDQVYFAVRKNYPVASVTSDSTADIAKSTATSGITFTSATEVKFRIDFLKADTTPLKSGSYIWEIKFKPSGEGARVVANGNFILKGDVVRAV
jgi:hypothetical protein